MAINLYINLSSNSRD